MLANDMKKGQLGRLRYTGWDFRIEDNMKGVTRVATVWGFAEDVGSIYIKDIAYLIDENGNAIPIEFSPAQEKQNKKIEAAGF